MFAVIDEKGNIRATSETKEGAFVEMETMADYHPLDDKEVVDLSNLPETLTDEQKYGIIRSIMNQKVPSLKDFIEDLVSDHEWYKECMTPPVAEEDS